MMEKVTLRFDPDELKALQYLASVERRDFRSQAAFIIRQELVRRGFLNPEAGLADPKPPPHFEECD